MSSFTLVSSQTQRLLSSMLSNREFTANYITKNRERLKKRNHNLIEGLRSVGIECLKGNAGLFCWINLTPLLEKASRESELEVWRKILEEAKLNISPGFSCHCSEAGWFRVHGTSLILYFPDVLIHTWLRALKTRADGSRIGGREVYGSDSIRKPVVPPGKVWVKFSGERTRMKVKEIMKRKKKKKMMVGLTGMIRFWRILFLW